MNAPLRHYYFHKDHIADKLSAEKQWQQSIKDRFSLAEETE